MRKAKIILFLIIVFSTYIFPVERVVLKERIDFDEKMIQNNVFLKMCLDFDFDGNFIYFLDRRYCKIFKVDIDSGKLIKTISSKGQGPGELSIPGAIKVKNNKIFVVDNGFSGIKIFDLNGSLLNEFKTNISVLGNSIDVNNQDEIFLCAFDSQNKTLVSVYDLQGKRTRSLIKYDIEIKKRKSYLKKNHCLVELDTQDNIYLLFLLERKLAKYDKKGELIWEQKIENEVLDKFIEDDGVKVREKTINISSSVFDFDITSNSNIIVAHTGGGCIFNPLGEQIKLVDFEEPSELFLFKVKGNKLINILFFGNEINKYSLPGGI